MSGGHWNYQDSYFKDQIFGYRDKPANVLGDLELSHLLWDLLNLLHDYDWYISGDSSEETWLKAKAEFKKKWLSGSRKATLESIIDSRLTELKRELKDML